MGLNHHTMQPSGVISPSTFKLPMIFSRVAFPKGSETPPNRSGSETGDFGLPWLQELDDKYPLLSLIMG